MPIYEYACTACGHEMEALQKISDSPLLTCPACGEDALTKQISKVAFRLKGTGWYETDFKDKKKGDDKDGSKTSSGSGGKSDKKSGGSDASSESGSKSSSGSASSSSSGDKKSSKSGSE